MCGLQMYNVCGYVLLYCTVPFFFFCESETTLMYDCGMHVYLCTCICMYMCDDGFLFNRVDAELRSVNIYICLFIVPPFCGGPYLREKNNRELTNPLSLLPTNVLSWREAI